MKNLGLQPSSHTYDGFVRAVVSERGYNDGMEVVSYVGLLHKSVVLRTCFLQTC